MCQRDYFKITLRFVGVSVKVKNSVEYLEETYALTIKRNNDGKSCIWIVTLERYELFKVIILSFYLKKNRNAKGAKKFKRNTGNDCIDAIMVLQMFRECIKLCRNKKNESYSFGFYALDDQYEEDAREDMNRRMAVFTKFLERHEDLKNHVLVNIGNIQDSIYMGYDPSITSRESMEEFINYYTPILKEEIKELFNRNHDSQKL